MRPTADGDHRPVKRATPHADHLRVPSRRTLAVPDAGSVPAGTGGDLLDGIEDVTGGAVVWARTAGEAADGDRAAQRSIADHVRDSRGKPHRIPQLVAVLHRCADGLDGVLAQLRTDVQALLWLRAQLLGRGEHALARRTETVLLDVAATRANTDLLLVLLDASDADVASQAAQTLVRARLEQLVAPVERTSGADRLVRLAEIAPEVRRWADEAASVHPGDPRVQEVVEEGVAWLRDQLGTTISQLLDRLDELFDLTDPDAATWSARRRGLERSVELWCEAAGSAGGHPEQERARQVLTASREAGDRWLHDTLLAAASAKTSVVRDLDTWQAVRLNGAVAAVVAVALATVSGTAAGAALLVAALAAVVGTLQRHRLAGPDAWRRRFDPPDHPLR